MSRVSLKLTSVKVMNRTVGGVSSDEERSRSTHTVDPGHGAALFKDVTPMRRTSSQSSGCEEGLYRGPVEDIL